MAHDTPDEAELERATKALEEELDREAAAIQDGSDLAPDVGADDPAQGGEELAAELERQEAAIKEAEAAADDE
ncbi:MAG TPA: hypothetical protein VGE07_21620 [Herpetosiphonaceae bacterium]